MKIDRSWISSLVNPIKLNKKNVVQIDTNGQITVKPQLLRSMGTKSKWREGSSMSKQELK